MSNKYSDIINLERPQSNYPKMSNHDRAAQFSPFAALDGHQDELNEVARVVEEKMILSQQRKEELNLILNSLKVDQPIIIEYFEKDLAKDGGKYRRRQGYFLKIDDFEKTIYLNDKSKILIADIYDIEVI